MSSVAMILAAVLCIAADAPSVPTSPREIQKLLVGRWYGLDVTVGQVRGPYRCELFLRPDGQCSYSLIPRDRRFQRRDLTGRWHVQARSIVFDWGGPDSQVVYSGPLYRLDLHQLQIRSPFDTCMAFYRTYKESQITLHDHP